MRTAVLYRRVSVHLARDIYLNHSLLITVKPFQLHSTYCYMSPSRIQDSAVGIVTKLQAGRPSNHGSIPSKGKRFFYLSPRPALRPTQALCQYDQRAHSLGLKWPRREADATSLFTSQVTNEFSYDSLRSLPYKSIPFSKASSHSAN